MYNKIYAWSLFILTIIILSVLGLVLPTFLIMTNHFAIAITLICVTMFVILPIMATLITKMFKNMGW